MGSFIKEVFRLFGGLIEQSELSQYMRTFFSFLPSGITFFAGYFFKSKRLPQAEYLRRFFAGFWVGRLILLPFLLTWSWSQLLLCFSRISADQCLFSGGGFKIPCFRRTEFCLFVIWHRFTLWNFRQS